MRFQLKHRVDWDDVKYQEFDVFNFRKFSNG